MKEFKVIAAQPNRASIKAAHRGQFFTIQVIAKNKRQAEKRIRSSGLIVKSGVSEEIEKKPFKLCAGAKTFRYVVKQSGGLEPHKMLFKRR